MLPNSKMYPLVSDSTLLLTFKKLLLFGFWYGIKEEHPKLSEKDIKIFYLFPNTYLVFFFNVGWIFLYLKQ